MIKLCTVTRERPPCLFFFAELTEEQKVLVEMILHSYSNEEKIKTINEAVVLVQSDLDFVLHELNKIS